MTDPLRLGVLASQNGTTLQALIDACTSQTLTARIVTVISNNSQSGAAQRAHRHTIPFSHLSSHAYPAPEALDQAICQALQNCHTDIVILAGYMKKLGSQTLSHFQGRILNTHPSLLPKFGGQGMYGSRVHTAVLAAGESTTGVSIHLVDGDYDTGPVIAQCQVSVQPDDTVDSLAERVQRRERVFLVETLQAIATGSLILPTISNTAPCEEQTKIRNGE